MRTNRSGHQLTLAGLTLVWLVLGACARTAGDGGPSASPASGETPPADGCATSAAHLTVAVNTPSPSACLPVGAVITIDSVASAAQPWRQIETSDPQILSCASSQHSDGSVTATCTALRPGTVTLSCATGPFVGDPHGPPQRLWTATVTVVATPN